MAPATNVVLLKSDEHNPRYSSFYGHPYIQTPNLDRLAERGVVFENCYCPSPLCMPSRSAFMSGRRVHEIQCYSNCNAFPFDYPSYGGELAKQGVHTVHMGKTDVYRDTAELGFSEFAIPGDRIPPGDKNIRRHPLQIREGAALRAKGYGPREGDPYEHDTAVIKTAAQWLRERPRALDRPFTLAVNLHAPHFPHFVTQELWDMYPEGGDLPVRGGDLPTANHPYALDLRAHFETALFAEEDIRGLRRGYLGCVTFVDRQLGIILDTLEEEGLLGNTIVAYTSDHGEMLGAFDMWWKCSLYEDSARVPLVVAGPGFPAGSRVKTPVDLLDVQATFFAATLATRPDGWSGRPLQTIGEDDRERVVFSEYQGHGTRGSAFMIRKGDWKLIYCAAAPHLLFNLAEDPGELNNLAQAHPAKLAELEEALRQICSPEFEDRRAEVFIEQQLAAMGV